MGICDSSKNQGYSSPKNISSNIYSQRNFNPHKIKENNIHIYNNENNIITSGEKRNIVEQNIIPGNVKPIPSRIEDRINEQMKASICKIYLGEKFETGFLCQIPFSLCKNPFPVLITNKNLINEEQLLNKKKINIVFDNDREDEIIYITSERRIYTSKKYDISFIEIFPEELKEKKLLLIDEYLLDRDISNKKNIDIDIYVIHYLNEANCIKSYGIIEKINENIINHTCSENSGGPILLLDSQLLIGINIGEGKGILLREPLKDFCSYISSINEKYKTIKNCIDCYYVIKNGEEFSLLHDYNNNCNEFVKISKNIDLREKKKFIKDNIDIYVDSQPIPFNYKYKTNNSKIHVKFLFKKIADDLSFMFFNCINLDSIDLSSYDMTNIIDMTCMLSGCKNLKSVILTSLKTNHDIILSYMFSGCLALKTVEFPKGYKINITNLENLFFFCSSLESLDLSSFNTIKVKNMSRIFCNCYNLNIINISSFRTDNVTDMSRMFANCTNLKSIDLSKFETRNVKMMNDMFVTCKSLITLDLSSFNTSNVENMQYMFMDCLSLRSINLSSFNTINVINMSGMFQDCKSLKFLDLSSFKTPNLVIMDMMFLYCEQLESIEMPNFKTNKVKIGIEVEHNKMIMGNNNSENINLSKFFLKNIFFGCNFLKTVKCNDKLILDMFNENKEFFDLF